jgi:general secretion pathway protein D
MPNITLKDDPLMINCNSKNTVTKKWVPTGTFVKCAIALSLVLATSGCTSIMQPDSTVQAQEVTLEKSYLESADKKNVGETSNSSEKTELTAGMKRLNSLKDGEQNIKMEIDLASRFKDSKTFQVSVNGLPLNDFIHYTFGELLNVSYLIEPSVKSNKTPVTLSLKEELTSQKLFKLARQILAQNGVNIALNNDIFYIHPLVKDDSKSDKAFGFGRTEDSVPNVSSEIIQLVPIQYGMSPSLRNTLNSLVDARISLDQVQGLLTIKGKRESVIRTLSLVQLLDSSAVYNKAVALMSFNYIDSKTFIEKLTLLFAQEGIRVGGKMVGSGSVNFIPIEHLGQVVVFATADEIIDRVEYWRKELDKPATGSEQSFYIYHPRFARAADLGQSLAPLIGGSLSGGSNTSNSRAPSNQTSASNNSGNQAAKSQGPQNVEGDNMRLVVDDRANALIFYSSGKHYQELQPIIKQLDTMPKQVMLEVVIAEVKLTGSFAKGVDFAIKNGSFGGDTNNKISFSGKEGFGYSLVGVQGNLNINLNQTDGLVNILSRPTLLVRDGVSASISVGDDIPTIGSTTSDPISGDRETTTIQYRKTGVDLTVTPTVNAQGTIIMTIEQNISNVTPTESGDSASPAVFERKISTEVVAGDGQTVLLGGLISENNNSNATSVPLLGGLPVIGHLFRSDSDSRDKTELVVLVTPKIVHNLADWQKIKQDFAKGLENLKL